MPELGAPEFVRGRLAMSVATTIPTYAAVCVTRGALFSAMTPKRARDGV
jgi:hypothetical protein